MCNGASLAVYRRRHLASTWSIVNIVIHDSHMMIVTTTLTAIYPSRTGTLKSIACLLRKSQTKKTCHSIEFCFQSSLLAPKRKLPKFASAHPRHTLTQSLDLELNFPHDISYQVGRVVNSPSRK